MDRDGVAFDIAGQEAETAAWSFSWELLAGVQPTNVN
jgi:hypothetical protein